MESTGGTARTNDAGFKINALTFSDAETGEVMWRADTWPEDGQEEVKVEIPARILGCAAVAREVKFSSKEKRDKLSMQQLVYQDAGNNNLIQVEEWTFNFGFVIPESHNSWQSTTVAAGNGKMVDPAVASGRVVIVTKFLDGEDVISEMRVRVYYV